MPRPVHFEIYADNPTRAIGFYTGLFGWKCTQYGQEGYWLLNTESGDEPGINGAILKRTAPQSATEETIGAFVITMDIPNVDDYAMKVTKLGGRIVKPKMAIAGVGYTVYCRDTEGNIFGMIESDEHAQ